MSDQPDNLVLTLLRAIRTAQGRHARRLASIERTPARRRADPAADAMTDGARSADLEERIEATLAHIGLRDA